MGGSGAPLVLLMGPTAAGKTALAVALAESGRYEIVSVDSAMVYRGLDIGTGKPPAEVLARAPHWLIDIRDPEQRYSAAEFRSDALAAIAAIRARGRVPLLVGGTGLYFRALREGLSELPAADPALRARLAAEARAEGWAALHRRLAALDPEAARRIHPNDPQRIQRALEVCELSGRPLSALWRERARRPFPGATCTIVLEPAERGWLHRRIEQRFDAMLAAGLIEEVRALRARPGMHAGRASMRAVGYRQVWQHLEGAFGEREMRARAIAATRQLARRQLTWLRAEPVDARLDCARPDLVAALGERLARLERRS